MRRPANGANAARSLRRDRAAPRAQEAAQYSGSLHFVDCQREGVIIIRTRYIDAAELDLLRPHLSPMVALVVDVMLSTGLRVGDVVALSARPLERWSRITVRESKTGKSRRIRINPALANRLVMMQGVVWAFPSRSKCGHITRQGVYIALRRACKRSGVGGGVGCHSVRKCYAVRLLRRYRGDIARVQCQMRHDNPSVTMLYALADVVTVPRWQQAIRASGGGQGSACRPRKRRSP